MTVHGVGINDAEYKVYETKGGKIIWVCPYYKKWTGMLQRCYSAKEHARCPTYIDCTVCDDWIYFSKFRAWMITQDWEGKQLDKDILVVGNKIYSPDTCVFLDKTVNLFTTDRVNDRGAYPIGVCFHKQHGKFTAHCCNPFASKLESLGDFTDPEQAHLAWRARKHELACQLAESDYVTDERVSLALRNRYL